VVLAVGRRRRDLKNLPAVDAEDLDGGATIGLIRAAEGFDSSFGVRFSTYAVPWIEEGIKGELSRAGAARVTGRQRRRGLEWRRLSASGLGDGEIAARMGLSGGRERTTRRAAAAIGAAVGHEGEGLFGTAAVEPGDDPSEVEDWVHEALSRIPAIDRETLVLRYGIGGGRPMTNREIAEMRGCSRQNVDHALRRAHRRLAEALGEAA
jgi:RNA polymerase primary sigma factor